MILFQSLLKDTLSILPSQNLQISKEYSVVFLVITGDKPKNLSIWQFLVSWCTLLT